MAGWLWSEEQARCAIAEWTEIPAGAQKRRLAADLIEGLIGMFERESFAHPRDHIDQALTALWQYQFDTARKHMMAALDVVPSRKRPPTFDTLRRRAALLRESV